MENGSASLVRQEKIIRAAPVPDGINRKRISNDDDAFAAGTADRSEHFVEHVRISGINGNDQVGFEATEQGAKFFLKGEEDLEVAGKTPLPIEPAISRAPNLRHVIDHGEVGFAHVIVQLPVGVGKKIMHFDLQTAGYRGLEQAGANAARGAVVPFAKAGR